MFTGLVTDIGEILGVEQRAEGLRRLSVASDYDAGSIAIGASIACSGICLTAVGVEPRGAGAAFEVDAAAETLSVTTAGSWRPGTRVNLERSLKVGDELGGHIVSGHVDGLGELLARENLPEMARLVVRAPAQLARFIAAKGSVALDGVSLTVNTVEDDRFSVLIIPHTLAVTTLGLMQAGARLNLEVDLIARYAARLLERR
jgi:riboflavin synthase